MKCDETALQKAILPLNRLTNPHVYRALFDGQPTAPQPCPHLPMSPHSFLPSSLYHPSSFSRNLFRYILDSLVYRGLLGEIFIGVFNGLPSGGSAWLSLPIQEAGQSLGLPQPYRVGLRGGPHHADARSKEDRDDLNQCRDNRLTFPIALSFLLLRLSLEGAYPSP